VGGLARGDIENPLRHRNGTKEPASIRAEIVFPGFCAVLPLETSWGFLAASRNPFPALRAKNTESTKEVENESLQPAGGGSAVFSGKRAGRR
jgi:hypothetical protein